MHSQGSSVHETVLVHGAAGFVASSLIPQLLERRCRRLVLVDRRPVPAELLQCVTASGVDIHVHQSNTLSDVRDEAIDTVICLAGETNVDTALEEPHAAFDANVRIALDLAEWLRLRSDRPRAVYLSSDEVLGVTRRPLSEDAPLQPTQPYAASKAAAEIILHNYRDVYDLDVVTLRSCNLVGGAQRARKLIPVAVKALMDHVEVPIYGSGRQLREWMAVTDLCDAVVRLLDRTAPSGVYHAASGTHLAVNDVVHLVAAALHREVRTRRVQDRRVHDDCYAMDSSRLRALGWAPQTDPARAITEAARQLSISSGTLSF